MIDPIIDMIKNLSVSPGFSDYLGDQHRCRRHYESSRFGDNLDIRREVPLAFRIDDFGQLFELRNLGVVGYGESSADVYNLKVVPLFPGLMKNIRRYG